MLASAHSVSENGAPAATLFGLAEGAIDYSVGAFSLSLWEGRLLRGAAGGKGTRNFPFGFESGTVRKSTHEFGSALSPHPYPLPAGEGDAKKQGSQ